MRVKCLGGRELRGALRGYDELVNLVLDDCEEFIRGESLSSSPKYTYFCGFFIIRLVVSHPSLIQHVSKLLYGIIIRNNRL